MPDQSTIPIRPSTPTLDTFYLNYGAGNPRYEESANGVIDLALNAFQTDKTFESAKALVNADEVSAAQKYLDDVEAYITLHGGFWSANDAPAAGDHTDVSSLEQNTQPATAAGEPDAPAAPVAPAVTNEAQLTVAPPAPSTEATTHVIVPNDHISFLHRLVDDVEHEVEGAEQALVRAFRRVFERTAA